MKCNGIKLDFILHYDPYALAFLKAIQVAFQYKKENHNEIVQLLKDFKARGSSTKRVKELLKGLEVPKEHQITLSSQLESGDMRANISFIEEKNNNTI
jgi:hypothetical protein